MKKITEAFLTGIVLFFAGCIFLLSNHIGGWRAFIVLSPSMEPAVTTGSLVLTQQIPPRKLQVGDIITFIRPDNTREFITHRIVSIDHNKSVLIIHTKGDKNTTADTWVLAGGGVVGKVLYSLPHLGYLLSLSKTKIGIATLILIPAAIILYLELTKVFTLLHSVKGKKGDAQTKIVIIFLFVFFLEAFSAKPTYALLSDKVSLIGNTFTITPANDCSNGSTTIIENNSVSITTVSVSANTSPSGSSSATVTVSQVVNTTKVKE